MKQRLQHLFDLLFIALFSYSIIILIYRPEPYSRPVEYFVCMSLIAALIGVEIQCLPNSNSRVMSILLKIVLLGSSLRLTPQLLFPGLIGIDPWSHRAFTERIITAGRIPTGFGYSGLPLFHLTVSATSLLTGLPYKEATIASIGTFSIAGSVLIFLIGRKMLNLKLGLFAALVATTADWLINTSFWTIPNTLGLSFILVLTYLILKQNPKNLLRVVVIELVFSAALIMTHTISALAMLLVLACFALSTYFMAGKDDPNSKGKPVALVAPALFAVMMFSWWDYISGSLTFLANSVHNLFSLGYLTTPKVAIQYRYGNLVEFFLGTVGILIFYLISLAGILLFARKTKNSLALALGGIITSLIAFSGYLFSLSGLYPQRWFPYSQAIMAIFGAFALLWVAKLFKDIRKSALSIFMIILVMSFFSICSPISNVDSPVYTPNITVRYLFYQSEMKAADTIQSVYNGTLYTDSYYRVYFTQKSVTVGSFSENIIVRNFTGMNTLAIRRSITKDPFYLSGYLSTYRLNYDVPRALDNLGYNRIYDSGTVYLYKSPQP